MFNIKSIGRSPHLYHWKYNILNKIYKMNHTWRIKMGIGKYKFIAKISNTSFALNQAMYIKP